MLFVIRSLSLSLQRSEAQTRSMPVRKHVLSRFVDCNLSASSRTSLQLRGCQ